MDDITLIAGRSYLQLVEKIADRLDISLTPVEFDDFANGETYVRIKKEIRNDDVFILQTFCGDINQQLVELLLLTDAAKRASAGRINLICPHLCYSRQDRKILAREPISAKMVADLFSKAGADRVITVDLHAPQIQGFYDIPIDHFFGYPQFAKYLCNNGLNDTVIVSPDVGGTKRVNKMADLLNLPLAIIDKVRHAHNKAEVAHVVGDVKGKTAVLMDDIIDTAGSITAAAEAIKEHGAKKVIICATHALLSGPALKRLEKCPAEKIILLDTIPLAEEKRLAKMEVLPLDFLWAEIIECINQGKSLGKLFDKQEKQALKV